jgi:hypothetical protein
VYLSLRLTINLLVIVHRSSVGHVDLMIVVFVVDCAQPCLV